MSWLRDDAPGVQSPAAHPAEPPSPASTLSVEEASPSHRVAPLQDELIVTDVDEPALSIVPPSSRIGDSLHDLPSVIVEEEPAEAELDDQQRRPHPPPQMRRESAPVASLSAAEPRVQRFRRSFSRASRVSSTDILPEQISRRSSEARDLIAKSRTSPVKQLDATPEKGVKWKRMMTPFFGTTLRKMMAGQETAERQTRLDEIRKTLDARYDAL